MTFRFETVLKEVQPSRVSGHSTVILTKRLFDGEVLVKFEDHAVPIAGDLTNAGVKAKAVEDLSVSDLSLGLVPLSAESIERAIFLHETAHGAAKTGERFSDAVARAVVSDPQFSVAAAKLAERAESARNMARTLGWPERIGMASAGRVAVELKREVMFGAGTLGLTDKQADNVFVASAKNGG